MILRQVSSLSENQQPLELVDWPKPEPAAGEIRVRVSVCGVCHTELDEIEGRTIPPRFPVVLGHQVVGRVDALAPDATEFVEGDRVGVGWIHSSSGDDRENLSDAFCATGRDVDGGYAEYMTVPTAYAYPIPSCFQDHEAAPLLCAGAIGYRALRLTGLVDGEWLGLMGFGGSAHLVLQMVQSQFPRSQVFVFARDPSEREFAKSLGAVWAGDIHEPAPEQLHAVIDTTPVWSPVVASLARLRPGGRLVINAIRKQDADKSALLDLNYHDHLWMEREIKTVANISGRDLREFLPLAAEAGIRPHVTSFPLEAANQALLELKQGGIRGAKVLTIE